MKILHTIVILFTLAATTHASTAISTVVIDEPLENIYRVTAHVLFDSTGKLTFTDIISGEREWIVETLPNRANQNLSSTAWMRFMVVNAANKPVNYKAAITGFDSVQVYQFRNGRLSRYITGILVRPSDKAIDAIRNYLPLHLAAGDTLILYLRFEKKGIYTNSFNNITIRSDKVIEATSTFNAVYTGTLLMLIAISLLMFWLFRDRLYLVMVLTFIGHLTWFADSNGLIHQVFNWSPYFSKYMNQVFVSWFFPFTSLFLLINYISLRRKVWLFAISILLLILLPVSSVVQLVFDVHTSLINLCSLAVVLFSFAVCIYLGVIKKEKPALIFLLFLLPLLIAAVLFLLQAIFRLNWFQDTTLLVQIGSLISCFIIGYAVYDRVNTTITERLRAMKEKETLVREQNLILEGKVEERTLELAQEKAKSESILLNILPSEVAEELKETGGSQARLFENVTVLFTDFVGFTKAAEQMTAHELVAELHNCFKGFDDIIQKHQLEKIKTVGDAYIAVAGLPVPLEDHACRVVKAAIEICDFMKVRQQLLQEKTFSVRVGIHSGSVVAGIVGVKKFAYDIWGDTVNTAARMEQSSEAGKINISHTTYELIKKDFNCTFRGKINAKNKGGMRMYFVEGHRISQSMT